ncbi:MAG: penicillin-binding transpeptidase domain-containing protein [Nocardioidaceae bacterium]
MARPRTLLVTSLLLGLAATSCTSGGSAGPTPEDAAARLAAGLASGWVAGLPLTGSSGPAARTWLLTATAGLDGSRRTVSVTKVSTAKDGATATATLHWSWDLAGTDATWAYDVPATLTRRADSSWATRWQPGLLAARLRTSDTLDLTSAPAKRADILGAGGTPLVTERPVVRFGIDKLQVKPAQQQASARALAALLGVDPGSFSARVKAAGPHAFVEALVVRKNEVPAALTRSHPDIPGLGALVDKLPLAPTREFARPILGTFGPVTAEIVKASKGAYGPGDEAGLSGLQQRYDAQLRGTPGVAVVARPAGGGAPRRLFATRSTPGKSLRTTLDPALQSLAERVLAGVGPASALVAVRPSDGHLLAAASGPGGGGLSTATVGRYAPGSTFKVVSSLALLRAGLTPDSPLDCTRSITVDGKRFENYDDYPASGIGRIPLRTAVADSCNTAFISQAGTVSAAELAEAGASLGIGVDHDLGFPVFFGSVPSDGTQTEHAASMIGQGTVLASPFAMATVAASVAAGHTVVPVLLPDVSGGVKPPGPALTAAEASRLRELMRGVVTSGSGSFLSSLPDPPVLAKTGTAEFGDRKPPQTHAWMVAVHGDLAVAVFVDLGSSGSGTAGPLLERFLRGA